VETKKSSLESDIEQHLAETGNELFHLAKLHEWLNKNIIDSRFDKFIIVAALPVLPLILLAMVLFTPLMVKTLKLLKRKGWLIGLSIIVSLPLLLAFIADVFAVKVFLIGMSIIGYFMFCYILKIEVDDWYKEMKAKIAREVMGKNKEDVGEDDWIIMR
jgi:hypothetical protein